MEKEYWQSLLHIIKVLNILVPFQLFFHLTLTFICLEERVSPLQSHSEPFVSTHLASHTNILADFDSKQDPICSNASSFDIHYQGASLTMIRSVGRMEEYQCKIYSHSMQFLSQNKCMRCCPDGKSIQQTWGMHIWDYNGSRSVGPYSRHVEIRVSKIRMQSPCRGGPIDEGPHNSSPVGGMR